MLKNINLDGVLATAIQSPYALDRARKMATLLPGTKIFFDGAFKGDYSLAIVNRQLARSLMRQGFHLTLHSREEGLKLDPMLNGMPDVRSAFASNYPTTQDFDIHIRNIWPPRVDDMVGRRLNAYVSFAWEELEFPKNIVKDFNLHLDLVMVTANFVEQSLRHSGVTIPIAVVGNGTDHILEHQQSTAPTPEARSARSRILHVSSCFPRKGADLLVKAFSEAFTNSDNVELLIKTFDNPHNNIDIYVQRAREARPEAPPMTVLKTSMSNSELAELIRTSDLLVAPSRGEGFGLPLAEAILLDVPVVVTAYGGQLDFCNEQTAWLVKFHMAPSLAHVSTAGALWAEPDLASLGRQMHSALSDKAASKSKVARGQALLKTHFKWSDVARRVAQALQSRLETVDVSRLAEVPERISVDLVSTWNQVCGIASYSEHLFATPVLAPVLARVLAREICHSDEEVSASHPTAAVTRPWGYDAAGIQQLKHALESGRSEVVWFQHHPGFFSNADMEQIADTLIHSSYRLKAVTLHNVRETLRDDGGAWLKCFDLLVVHTKNDAEMLAARGYVASVIPHGILSPMGLTPAKSNDFTVGTFGFLYPHKNVPLLVEAFALARTVEPRLRLKALNCTRKDPVSWKERVRVEALIDALGLSDAVETDFGYLEDRRILEKLGQCNLLIFPYGESSESATGAARIALAADRPLLCSQSSVLSDILPLSLVLARTDASTIADALITLAANPTLLHMRDRERKAFVTRYNYPAVAKQHLKLIASHLGE